MSAATQETKYPHVTPDAGVLYVHFSTTAPESLVSRHLRDQADLVGLKLSCTVWSVDGGYFSPLLVTAELSASPSTTMMSVSARTQHLLRNLKVCLAPYWIGETVAQWQLALPLDLEPLNGAPS